MSLSGDIVFAEKIRNALLERITRETEILVNNTHDRQAGKVLGLREALTMIENEVKSRASE